VESEQLKLLRDGFESWNRGAWEETLENFSPDVVWRTGGFFPGFDPIYEGHEGLRRFFTGFIEPWDEVSIVLEDVVDDRPGQLLVRARFQARGREGIEVDGTFFQLYRFDENDLVVEFDGYEDEAEARRASGLDG
jgi:ketosteroid isomerase-like protein